jgi:branched-chain amino acid transport system substrate-binding protein
MSRLSRCASGRAVWPLGLLVLLVTLAGCSTRAVPPLEPPATVRRGDDAFRYQEYDSAVLYYKAYLDRTWRGDYTPTVAYQCALAQYRLKRYSDAVATLNDLQSRYPDMEWVQVQALRGDCERALGNNTLAILEWDDGWDLGSAADQDKLRLRIVTVAKRMPPDKVAQTRELVQHEEVRELLYAASAGAPAPKITAPIHDIDDTDTDDDEYAGSSAPPPLPLRSASATSNRNGRTGSAASFEPDPLGRAPMPPASSSPPPPPVAKPLPTPAIVARSKPVEVEPAPELEPDPLGRGRVSSPPEEVEASENAAGDTSYDAGETAASASGIAAVPPRVGLGEASRRSRRGREASGGAEPAAPAAAEETETDIVATAPPAAVAPGVAKVAALLPMSGRSADLGQRAWRALQLAFGDQADRLVLKDSGGDPKLTRGVLGELWRDPHVVAVIGPITTKDAEAVAPIAAQDRLPILPLSQEADVGGPFVLQVGMTRNELVGALVTYAVERARLSRFGVLYPDDADGRAFLSAFRSAVDRKGGKVLGTIAYPPGANVIPRYADTMFQWRQKQDVDAIFLADGSVSAAQLASFLQDEMPDVTLLGAQGWEDLAGEVGGGRLSGVLFAGGFYVRSERPATREFVERYREMYGTTPSSLHARAYDAGTLVKRALTAGGDTRAAMLQELRALGTVDGATGELRVTPNGLERSVLLLRLYDGQLQEVGSVG